MTDTRIYIVDQVTTKPGMAKRFYESYMARYAPTARARGMTLEHFIAAEAVWLDDQPNSFTIIWSVPDVAASYHVYVTSNVMQLDGTPGPDPEIVAWWRDAESMIEKRVRMNGCDAGNIDNLMAAGSTADV